MPMNGNHGQQQGQPTQPQQGRVRRIRPIGAGKAFALGVLASLLVSAAMSSVLVLYANHRDNQASAETKQAILDQREYVNEELAKFGLTATDTALSKVTGSVANITVSYTVGGIQQQQQPQPEAQPQEGQGEAQPQDAPVEVPPEEQPAEAQGDQAAEQSVMTKTTSGSGVVIQQTDTVVYVLTNHHVVNGAKEIVCSIQGVDYVATQIGSGDPSSDLAVLKIDGVGEKLTVATRGSSSELRQGDWVMTIGNPHGFHDSMSTGVVSALGRNLPSSSAGVSSDVLYANMIQTDVALNPGNSGGGLWDVHGNLVGICTLIWSMDGGNEGTGFAIPGDYAFRIAENIINGQAPAHAVIGAQLDSVPDSAVSAYGLRSRSGAYITSITKAGAAENASLAQGDIITSIDGQPISTVEDVLLIVRGHAPNDKIEIGILRQGMEMKYTLVLGSDAA